MFLLGPSIMPVQISVPSVPLWFLPFWLSTLDSRLSTLDFIPAGCVNLADRSIASGKPMPVTIRTQS
jgi:hypothetical protein